MDQLNVFETKAALQDHFTQLIDVLRSTHVTDQVDLAVARVDAIEEGKRYVVTISGESAGVIFWVSKPGMPPYRSRLICHADGQLSMQADT